jgi:hypothetical protein
MKATQFISKWKDLIKDLKDNTEFLKCYRDDTSWTELVLGDGKKNGEREREREVEDNNPMTDKSRLGAVVIDDNSLRYRKEDAKIDLVFGKENFIIDVKNSNKINNSCFYPKVYEIIVEHENNIATAWQEMVKLTTFRAKLKVLITYNWGEDENDKKDYSKNIETTAQNFGNIIKQTNEVFPENPDTEYLLIIGQRKVENVFWHYFIYNAGIIMEEYKD